MPLSQQEQLLQDIRASVLRIERDTEELRRVVLQGNGRPALTERVALLEARPAHPPKTPDRRILRLVELLVTGLVSIVTAVVLGRSAGKD